MRLKSKIEGELVQITSDLVEARLKSDWDSGQTSYLLGLSVALTIVLKPEMSLRTARQVIINRIDRSVTNIKRRPDYQPAKDFDPAPLTYQQKPAPEWVEPKKGAGYEAGGGE
jgi:hypothetical protein